MVKRIGFMFLSMVVGVAFGIAFVATPAGQKVFAEALQQISAYQNQDIKIAVNGKPVDLSSEDGPMYPIVFNGHSYVSAKALAEAMGGTVNWNSESMTVEVKAPNIINPSDALPIKDKTNTKETNPTDKRDESGEVGSNAPKIRIITELAPGFNKDEMTTKMNEQARLFFRVFTATLGENDKYFAIMAAHYIPEESKRKATIQTLVEEATSLRKSLGREKILKLSKSIQGNNLDDTKLLNLDIKDDSVTYIFEIRFGEIISHPTFVFKKLGNWYELDAISISPEITATAQ